MKGASSDETSVRDVPAILAFVRNLRRHAGPEPAFWSEFARGAALLCRADGALILARTPDEGWAIVSSHDAAGLSSEARARFTENVLRLADRTADNGFAFDRVDGGMGVIACALDTGEETTRTPLLVAVALSRHTQT